MLGAIFFKAQNKIQEPPVTSRQTRQRSKGSKQPSWPRPHVQGLFETDQRRAASIESSSWAPSRTPHPQAGGSTQGKIRASQASNRRFRCALAWDRRLTELSAYQTVAGRRPPLIRT